MPKKNVHPDAQSRVQHYLESVDDYKNLSQTFPLPKEARSYGDLPDRDKWTVALHAAILRKYFAKTDELYLATVVKSIRECEVAHHKPAEEWDKFEKWLTGIPDLVTYSIGGRTFEQNVLLSNEIYGRHLHGDYEKWMLSKECRLISGGLNCMRVHHQAHRVSTLASWVKCGVRDGALRISI